MKNIKITINQEILENYYENYYFPKYPRRKKKFITSPIPLSLNQWMIMPRHQMNGQKQAWKEFGVWVVEYYGLCNKKIDKCNIVIEYFFEGNRRRDADNYTPKNLFDSFTASGLLVDDDFSHVESLTIKGNYSNSSPRMEINIYYKEGNDGTENL